MNAAYYNAEPGSRSIDEMFHECDRAREDNDWSEAREGHLSDSENAPETSDDVDDAYDRERDREYEEDFD